MNQYEIHDGHPRQRARQLRRRGIDGRKVGATQIHRQLVKEFGADDSRVPISQRTVHNWMKDVEWLGEDEPCDFRDVSSELRSYVGRLDLVKSACLGGVPLTNRESRHAKRALAEFQDPHGEAVDLIAQYAIVWELAEREVMEYERSDIESMFVFAPWRSKENSELYLLSVQNGFTRNPPVLRLISPVVPYGARPPVFEIGFGAYAQLGLPWFFGWIQNHPDGQKFVINNRREDSDEPMTIEHWKPMCDWRKLVEGKLTGNKPVDVRIHIDREAPDDQR